MATYLWKNEVNPVLLREVRARWRKWPTFAIVFGYAILLAVAIGWTFVEIAGGNSGGGRESRTALLGYQLFGKLSWLQLLGWMLLAPVLAAPAIAGEREAGLMDGLHLCALTPREILRGKLQSVLWFVGLMLLVPLPVTAICFQMGGVSPQEVVMVTLLTASTAITGAAMGLHDSSHAASTGAALRAIFYHLLLWAGSSVFCCVGFVASPLPALSLLLREESYLLGVGLAGLTVVCQALMTLRLLSLAEATLTRSLTEDVWAGALPGGEFVDYGSLPPPSGYRTPLDDIGTRPKTPPAQPLEIDQSPFNQNYFFSRIKVRNPILQFELTRRFRMRRNATADIYNAFMAIGMCYAFFLFLANVQSLDAQSALRRWEADTQLWLLVIVVAAAVMGAATFSRDREQSMLEPIFLSPVTNAQLIQAKLGAVLIVCGAHSVLAVPAMAACIRSVADTQSGRGEVSLTQALLTVLVVALSTTVGALLGVSFSWICRRSFVAIGWTLALLFLFVFCTGWLLKPASPAAEVALSYWHPSFALGAIVDTGRPWPERSVAVGICCVVLALVSALLVTFLLVAMRDRARVRDRAGLQAAWLASTPVKT